MDDPLRRYEDRESSMLTPNFFKETNIIRDLWVNSE